MWIIVLVNKNKIIIIELHYSSFNNYINYPKLYWFRTECFGLPGNTNMALGKHNPITTRHSNSLNHRVIPHSSVSSGFRKDLKISYFFRQFLTSFHSYCVQNKSASALHLPHCSTLSLPFLSFFNLFLKDRRERKKIRNFQMEEGKGSTLVHLLVVVLSLVAFGFAIAAERRRSIVRTPPLLFPFLFFSLPFILSLILVLFCYEFGFRAFVMLSHSFWFDWLIDLFFVTNFGARFLVLLEFVEVL